MKTKTGSKRDAYFGIEELADAECVRELGMVVTGKGKAELAQVFDPMEDGASIAYRLTVQWDRGKTKKAQVLWYSFDELRTAFTLYEELSDYLWGRVSRRPVLPKGRKF